jgi:DNA-binding GntR family transcriptional regulator
VSYREIMQDLLHRIETGQLRVGDRLPSERDLSESTGAAVGTVRHAMQELQAQGITEGRRGTGHFVRRVPATPSTPAEPEDHLAAARQALTAAQAAHAPDVDLAQAHALVSIAETLHDLRQRPSGTT